MTIRIDNLVAGYRGRPVLKEVNIGIEAGRVCALLGCNGSGKTTLLRCVNALIRPLQGEVLVKGRRVRYLSRAEIARLISVVPQVAFSPFSFSCLEIVLMGEAARLKIWSSPGQEAYSRALEVCEEVGIGHLVNRSFNELSGGERQLVLLARALFQEAPVMLLDEPNSHLDFRNQHRIMELMRQIVKLRGVTVLVTLHDPNLALMYCDEAIMLKEGQVVARGPVNEVINDANLTIVYGDNIRTDCTTSGLSVVVPKNGTRWPAGMVAQAGH